MTNADIVEKLQPVFDGILPDPVRLDPELNAKDVAGWDSLAHILIIVAVEKAFAVRFRVSEMESAKNVGELVRLIAAKLAARS